MFCPGRSITRSAMDRAMVSKLWAVMVSKLFMIILWVGSVLDVSGDGESQKVLEPLTTPAMATNLISYLLQHKLALMTVEHCLLGLEAEEATSAFLYPSFLTIDGKVHVLSTCPDVVEELSYVVHDYIMGEF